MGVYFEILCVKKVGDNKIIPVQEIESVYHSYSIFRRLFSSEDNDDIKQLLSKKVSFDWVDKHYPQCYYPDKEINIEFCWDPKDVLNSVEAVYDIIKEYSADFPTYYLFTTDKKTNQPFMSNVFYKNLPYWLEGGWDYCVARPEKRDERYKFSKDSNRGYIDLYNLTELDCNEIIYNKRNNKYRLKKGNKVKIYIVKQSYFEYHQHVLDEMKAFCKKALENDYLLFSFIC